MVIFDEPDVKVNFVDEENVVLGYDMRQDCCETAFWFLSDKIAGEEKDYTAEELKGFLFVTDFCEVKEEEDGMDERNTAIFKLVDVRGQCTYVHLGNCQNGYYSHRFMLEKKQDEKRILFYHHGSL